MRLAVAFSFLAAIFLGLLWVAAGYFGFVSCPPLGFRPITAAVESNAQSLDTPDELYAALDELLGDIVFDGLVDYRVVVTSELLESVADGFDNIGPISTPEHFTSEHDQLAYYINAYNVLTLLGVKRSLPISSVKDVRGWVDPVSGFGFFFAYRVRLDGSRTSLQQLEQGLIRPRFGDPRAHAALNCASASCPQLHERAFRGDTLDVMLDEVTKRWLMRDDALRLDIDDTTIPINGIFYWYAEDFSEQGTIEGALDWAEAYLSPDRLRTLQALRSAGALRLETPYDWSLNAHSQR